jgi:hypothetical protein
MPYVTEDYIFIRVLLFCFTVLSGLGCLVLSPRETLNSRTPLPGKRSLPSLYALSTCSLPSLYALSTRSLPSLYMLSTRSLHALYTLSTLSLRALYALSTHGP